MATLKIEVKDEIIKKFGNKFTKDFLERQLKILQLEEVMEEMKKKIIGSKMDYQAELEKVREDAWKEYKEDFLSE